MTALVAAASFKGGTKSVELPPPPGRGSVPKACMAGHSIPVGNSRLPGLGQGRGEEVDERVMPKVGFVSNEIVK